MRSTNMVYGKPYLPSKSVDGIVRIRGKSAGWVYPKINASKTLDLAIRFAFVMVVGVLCLIAYLYATPAKAKTIELKECRTNAECLQIYCDGALVKSWIWESPEAKKKPSN